MTHLGGVPRLQVDPEQRRERAQHQAARRQVVEPQQLVQRVGLRACGLVAQVLRQDPHTHTQCKSIEGATRL